MLGTRDRPASPVVDAVLRFRDLADLERALRDERVLSVYVDGRVSDPATRDGWRYRLDDALRAHRAGLPPDRAEREAFDRAAAHLAERLPSSVALGASGWVAFVTPAGVAHAAALPVPVTSQVAWGTGARLARYAVVLARLAPVLVAVADGVQTRLYRYHVGVLDTLDVVRTERHDRPPMHIGSMPRVGFHTGTRGAPGTDEAERRRVVALAQAAAAVATRLSALADDDASIVVGGTPEAARAVRHALPPALARRATTLPSLHDGASEAEVACAAEEGAAALRATRNGAAVNEVLERAGGGDRAVVGREGVTRALADRAVQRVYVASGFLAEDADALDAIVRTALAQHATVEEVSGRAAERLAAVGGIAARLRYGGASHAMAVAAPARPLGAVPATTLVVCAASVGGIPALETILAALPDDFPAAVAIVQHRTPAMPNLLARVLARHSLLPVTMVETSDVPIDAGAVYLAPPDRHLLVRAGARFDVADGRRIHHLRSSANPLFDSAAEVYGDRLVAVVLTGTDSDATDGVRAVKARGGLVIAQDPATASARGMPAAAIATGAVDVVLPVEEIAPALVRFVARGAAARGAAARGA